MTNKITSQQLQTFFLEAVDPRYILTYNIEYQHYILEIIFLKYLSDEFRSDKSNNAFKVPDCAHWDYLTSLHSNIGSELDKAINAVIDHNPKLEGVFVADFTSKSKISDEWLSNLLSHLSEHRLCRDNFDLPDALANAVDNLTKRFADQKGYELLTPREVRELLILLLRPCAGMQVYDPALGYGGMLVSALDYSRSRGECSSALKFWGQEINPRNFAICKMSIILHGVLDADIQIGDSLLDPKHIQNGKIKQFDRVISCPPFGFKGPAGNLLGKDKYGRFSPKSPQISGDVALIQHMIASTKDEGKMAVIVHHGILYMQNNSMKKFRENLLANDLLEAVIGLPSKLFSNTQIAVAVLIINKSKTPERQGKMIFIDASPEYKEISGSIKALTNTDEITSLYENFQNKGYISKVITLDEIRRNEFNLNIRKYADNSEDARQLRALSKQQENFISYTLSDTKICLSIKGNIVNDDVDDSDNTIYLNRFTLEVVFDLSGEGKNNRSKYIGLKFNTDYVLSKYVAHFFASDLGKLILQAALEGVSARRISIDALQNCLIPVPPLSVQRYVIDAARKTQKLQLLTEKFSKDIALNPKSVEKISPKLGNL